MDSDTGDTQSKVVCSSSEKSNMEHRKIIPPRTDVELDVDEL